MRAPSFDRPARWLPGRSIVARFAAVALLLVTAYFHLSTLDVTSPTMDEPIHIVRGYAFVASGDEHLRLRNPILANALSGAALLLEPGLRLPPAGDPLWLDSEGAGLSEQFVWSNAAPPQRIVFLARLPIIFVNLLLGVFIFRWASERSGAWPALGALVLHTFCPNLLAHARLATTDTVTAATFLISAYAFDHALRTPKRVSRLWSGVTLGLALASKLSGVVLPVAFAIQAAARILRARGSRELMTVPVTTTSVTLMTGLVTLWAAYGFKVAPLEPGGLPLPAPSYWNEWQALDDYLQRPLPGYLLGQVSDRGWWYYYPIAFLAKTPLPVIVIMLLALARSIHKRTGLRDMPLWLAPSLLLGSLLFSPHDIGYRYLLPLLPFIFVAGADVLAAAAGARWTRIGVGLLLAWHAWGTLSLYPSYLAYFNELAGGPGQGRYILSDSNIDWGQDLIGLKRYADQNHLERVKLSYFGVTPPSLYGMKVDALLPVRNALYDQGAWWLHTYYPHDPPPGVYAISVANLMGGIWIDSTAYAYFRDRAPDATIGYSIYVYTVPARETPVNLSLSGLQIDQIDPDTYARFGSNDVRPRWFDATTSLIAAPGPAWIAIAESQPVAPALAGLLDGLAPNTRAQTVDDRQAYRLYFADLSARLEQAAGQSEQSAAWSAAIVPAAGPVNREALPAKFGETAELLGYRITSDLSPDDLTVITYWRAGRQVMTPLQMFVHALGADGRIVAQEDRLDVPAYGWREGDFIAQVNRLTLPAGIGPVWIEIGLYNIESGERLPVIVNGHQVDRRLLLKQIRTVDQNLVVNEP